MVKLKNPLLSLGAVGRLSRAITFTRRRHAHIAEKTPIPDDPRSLAQLSWRHMYQKAVALWHALSPAEQQTWQSQASRRHMTGFAWFMSQALRPNPGLYLPLQGGKMAGEIDMDGNRIEDLPFPANGTDPFRLQDYTALVLPFLMTQGVRVYHNIDQAIPHNTSTKLAFNSERYDTDAIHDNVTNNSRLTCKTTGKYLIAINLSWNTNATGYRRVWFLLNNTTTIATIKRAGWTVSALDLNFSTIYNLVPTDYIETLVFHTRGAPLDILSRSNYSPEFMMQRIGS